jgi:hypothetical protein
MKPSDSLFSEANLSNVSNSSSSIRTTRYLLDLYMGKSLMTWKHWKVISDEARLEQVEESLKGKTTETKNTDS